MAKAQFVIQSALSLEQFKKDAKKLKEEAKKLKQDIENLGATTKSGKRTKVQEANDNAFVKDTEQKTKSTKKLSAEEKAANKERTKAEKELTKFNQRLQMTSSSLGEVGRRVFVWGALSAAIFGALNSLKQAVDFTIQLNSAMAELKKVLPKDSDFAFLKGQTFELGFEFGRDPLEVAQILKRFGQAGLDTEQSIAAAKTALLGLNTTGAETEQVINAIIGANKIFGIEFERSYEVMDKIQKIQAEVAVDAKDLVQSITAIGPAITQLNGSMDDLFAITGALGEAARLSGKEASNAFKRVLARIVTKEGITALQELGVKVKETKDTFRPIIDIFADLGQAMKGATDVQKQNIAVTLAQVRQYPKFAAFLGQINRALEIQEKSSNASGAAFSANNVVMATYEKQIAQADVRLKQFGNTFIEGGVIKSLVDMKIALGELASISNETLSPALSKVILGGIGLTAAYKISRVVLLGFDAQVKNTVRNLKLYTLFSGVARKEMNTMQGVVLNNISSFRKFAGIIPLVGTALLIASPFFVEWYTNLNKAEASVKASIKTFKDFATTLDTLEIPNLDLFTGSVRFAFIDSGLQNIISNFQNVDSTINQVKNSLSTLETKSLSEIEGSLNGFNQLQGAIKPIKIKFDVNEANNQLSKLIFGKEFGKLDKKEIETLISLLDRFENQYRKGLSTIIETDLGKPLEELRSKFGEIRRDVSDGFRLTSLENLSSTISTIGLAGKNWAETMVEGLKGNIDQSDRFIKRLIDIRSQFTDTKIRFGTTEDLDDAIKRVATLRERVQKNIDFGSRGDTIAKAKRELKRSEEIVKQYERGIPARNNLTSIYTEIVHLRELENQLLTESLLTEEKRKALNEDRAASIDRAADSLISFLSVNEKITDILEKAGIAADAIGLGKANTEGALFELIVSKALSKIEDLVNKSAILGTNFKFSADVLKEMTVAAKELQSSGGIEVQIFNPTPFLSALKKSVTGVIAAFESQYNSVDRLDSIYKKIGVTFDATSERLKKIKATFNLLTQKESVGKEQIKEYDQQISALQQILVLEAQRTGVEIDDSSLKAVRDRIRSLETQRITAAKVQKEDNKLMESALTVLTSLEKYETAVLNVRKSQVAILNNENDLSIQILKQKIKLNSLGTRENNLQDLTKNEKLYREIYLIQLGQIDSQIRLNDISSEQAQSQKIQLASSYSQEKLARSLTAQYQEAEKAYSRINVQVDGVKSSISSVLSDTKQWVADLSSSGSLIKVADRLFGGIADTIAKQNAEIIAEAISTPISQQLFGVEAQRKAIENTLKGQQIGSGIKNSIMSGGDDLANSTKEGIVSGWQQVQSSVWPEMLTDLTEGLRQFNREWLDSLLKEINKPRKEIVSDYNKATGKETAQTPSKVEVTTTTTAKPTPVTIDTKSVTEAIIKSNIPLEDINSNLSILGREQQRAYILFESNSKTPALPDPTEWANIPATDSLIDTSKIETGIQDTNNVLSEIQVALLGSTRFANRVLNPDIKPAPSTNTFNPAKNQQNLSTPISVKVEPNPEIDSKTGASNKLIQDTLANQMATQAASFTLDNAHYKKMVSETQRINEQLKAMVSQMTSDSTAFDATADSTQKMKDAQKKAATTAALLTAANLVSRGVGGAIAKSRGADPQAANTGGSIGTVAGLAATGGNPVGGAVGNFVGSILGGLLGGKKDNVVEENLRQIEKNTAKLVEKLSPEIINAPAGFALPPGRTYGGPSAVTIQNSIRIDGSSGVGQDIARQLADQLNDIYSRGSTDISILEE